MSKRRISNPDTAARDTLREIEKRLRRLENGGAIAGEISLSSKISIGTVGIEVVDDGPESVSVVLTNLRTGSTYTIPIPAAE